MKVLNIIHGSIVDGEGMRTSIYFAGCKHRCKGCHNPQSWDFNSGVEMSVNEIFEDIKKIILMLLILVMILYIKILMI